MGCCSACCKTTTDGETRLTDPEKYAIHVKDVRRDTRLDKTVPVATEAFSEAVDDRQSTVRCISTLCRAISDKAIRSTDTEDDVTAKRYGIPLGITLFIINSVAFLQYLPQDSKAIQASTLAFAVVVGSC
eukprot:Hpha_TRINITY_DN28159_c0_g1::TRINITY_DN28159_c0_g1_i1::g.103324::m.103324